MVGRKKRGVKRKPNLAQHDLNLFSKEINRDIGDVVRIARRKFFKRLIIVVLITLVLYILIRAI
jgi:hypothetical protein